MGEMLLATLRLDLTAQQMQMLTRQQYAHQFVETDSRCLQKIEMIKTLMMEMDARAPEYKKLSLLEQAVILLRRILVQKFEEMTSLWELLSAKTTT